MAYQHRYLDGSPLDLPVGKVVCIGRNYLEHIRELNNAVPETPILFMKPSTSLVALDEPIRLPSGRGECHHEVELAVLVGRELRNAGVETARQAVAGYGVALDLTLRDLQNELKKKGHPWETAKAFDGSCPLSPFLKPEALPAPQATDLALQVNGEFRQQGNTQQMMVGIFELMAYISTHFTLQPGDVVLTGTPAGVGPLQSGDELILGLAGRDFTARMA
ncbi:MAG TPA: fumarylacetoacetate hydrolase family protein [Candidatus Competibacter sp.]|nr:fumarylacetoacetate hydrolase family protein [Candidatus Competibacter sp.]